MKYQKLHSQKKKLEEKLGTYPLNTCVLMGDSTLDGVMKSNLSNALSVKLKKFTGAIVNNLRHHALPISRKQENYSRKS